MIEFFNSYGMFIATGLAALAAIFSAVAAWRAPSISSRVRQEEEKMRIRHSIFFALMQSRANTTRETVSALNSIDIAFHDDRMVREAWADMYHATNGRDVGLMEEKRRVLLSAMAKSLGFAKEIRRDDLSRVYYPNIVAEEDLITDVRRRQAIAQLNPEASPSANTARLSIGSEDPA